MSMRPNFNSPLQLTNGGEKVMTAGPLNWEGTTGHCKISVEVWQGEGAAKVTATGKSGGYNDDEPDWDAGAATQNGATLAPGAAMAKGTVALENGTNPPPDPSWTQRVELH